MRPRRALVLVAVLALVASFELAGLAAAHAQPVQSAPPAGAVVRVPPRDMVITFSERLEPGFSRLEVRDANNTVVSEPATIDPDGLTMRAALPSPLPYGGYTASWRALSTVDGHSTRGILSFLFPDPSKPLKPGDLPSTGETTTVAYVPAETPLRAVVFVGLFAVLGFPVVVLGVVGRDAPSPWGSERRLGALALAASLAGAAAGLLLALLQGAAASGLGFTGALAQPSVALAGRSGVLGVARAALLALAGGLAFVASRRGAPASRPWWAAALALGGVATVTLSLGSHAAALQRWELPAIAADATHVLAAALWVAGLVALGWVLLRRDETLPWPRLAGRFSLLATWSSAYVVATGTLAGFLQLKGLGPLFTSDYGRVLLVKVALVVGLLAFGARNRFLLMPKLKEALDAEPLRRFARSVRAEAALGVGVLVVAAVLTGFSPPAPTASAGPPPVLQLSQDKDGANLTLFASPVPLRAGSLATLDLFITVSGLSDTSTTNTTLTIFPPDRTLGSSTVLMEHPHPGHFAAEGSYFTLPGNWTLRFGVQRTQAFDLVVDFTLTVEPA